MPAIVREPRSVLVQEKDCLFVQAAMPFNFVMLNQSTGRPIFPQDGENGPTARRLRLKVNALLLRFADEFDNSGNKKNLLLPLPLEYDEAWYLDLILSPNSYTDSLRFVMDVLRVIYEYENGVALVDGQTAFAHDKAWLARVDNETIAAMLKHVETSYKGPTIKDRMRGGSDDGDGGGRDDRDDDDRLDRA